VADRSLLSRGLRRASATLPEATHLLIAEVVRGIDGPALRYYSLGDSGFVFSHERYWPASTVKLIACVGALTTLHERGISGDAKLRFEDLDGVYLVGGGTHPGSGLPVIFLSSQITARMLAEKEGLGDPTAPVRTKAGA